MAVGVDGASLRGIAKRAKTSIAMVYYYFPEKDDLFLAVVEETYVALLGDLEAALSGTQSFEARVRALYDRIGSVTDEEVAMLRLVAREALTSPTRLGRLIERFKRGHVPLVIQTVFDGMRNGELSPGVHPLVIAVCTLVIGVFPQLAVRAMGARLPLAPPRTEDLREQLLGVLLHGVGARG